MPDTRKSPENAGSYHPETDPNDPTSDISRKLREYYESVESEAIPEHLLDLLEKLDEVEQSGDKHQ